MEKIATIIAIKTKVKNKNQQFITGCWRKDSTQKAIVLVCVLGKKVCHRKKGDAGKRQREKVKGGRITRVIRDTIECGHQVYNKRGQMDKW